MRVLVYEFCVGGGLRGNDPLLAPLRKEGAAMLVPLVTDFSRLSGMEVVTILEVHSPLATSLPAEVHHPRAGESCQEAVSRIATTCDAAIVIAPESDGWLTRLAEAVLATECLWIGPELACLKLASDKSATAHYLAERGMATPRGVTWDGTSELEAELRFPVVCKPVDGAGSQATQLLTHPDQLRQHAESHAGEVAHWRVEEFQAGLPASVAVICGAAGQWACPPLRQVLSDDGRMSYLGGERILDADLCHRAMNLVLTAAAQLPPARGYLGFDLVLGSAADGSRDVVIEVNPRLTTSYLGLRAISRVNLAEAMLVAARGEIPRLDWGAEPLRFSPAGVEVPAVGQPS